MPRASASRALARVTGWPPMRSSPRSGRRPPPRILRSVDLPAPFSPTTACDSPSPIAKLTSRNAATAPNDLPICRNSTAATLALETMRRPSGDAGPRDKQAAGGRLFRALAIGELDRRRGDVEIAKVRAAKDARCGICRRHAHNRVARTVGRVAMDGAAAPERHPQIAVGVERHAVRRSLVAWNANQRPAIRDRAASDVEVEDVDRPCWTVDEVHEAAVIAPVEAIRDAHAAQHRAYATARIETIQMSLARALVERHRPSPEASGGIAFPVVHPDIGTVIVEVRDRPHASGRHIEASEPATNSEQQIAQFCQRHRA